MINDLICSDNLENATSCRAPRVSCHLFFSINGYFCDMFRPYMQHTAEAERWTGNQQT
jgi:hypothetical protein